MVGHQLVQIHPVCWKPQANQPDRARKFCAVLLPVLAAESIWLDWANGETSADGGQGVRDQASILLASRDQQHSSRGCVADWQDLPDKGPPNLQQTKDLVLASFGAVQSDWVIAFNSDGISLDDVDS